MKATNKLALALALVLGSSQALALGLGQIRVKSALNQPLRAEIPVLADNASELDGLRVALASPDAFAQAGLRMSRLEVPLAFKLVRQGSSAVIEVSSEQPVGDPALDFLIEVNWANGKLLREYSVLLDPPATMVAAPATRAVPAATGAAAAPNQPATQPPAATTANAAPVAAPAEVVATAPASTGVAAVEPAATVGETYTVASGDTLWRIASEASAGGDVNRMMLAIQRANPEAFINDNVNTMRRGAVLRIPGSDEVQRISASEARSEIRRQMDQWHASRASAPSLLAQSGDDVGASAPSARSNAAVDGHLELLPPGGADGGEGRSGVQGGTGSAEIAGLQGELARAHESLASEQQKSSELGERVKSLEDINEKNQRLLELKNSEIAELQNKLAAASETAESPVAAAVAEAEPPAVAASAEADIWGKGVAASASASEPAGAATAAEPLAVAASSAAEAAAASAAETPVPAAVAPEADAAKTETKPTSSQPAAPAPDDAQPWYMRPVTWLAAGIVLVVLLLLSLLKRRRKPTSALVDEGGAVADDATVAPYGDDSEDEYALLDEIEQHPEELSLHLELASLYYAHRDVEKFEAAAERMHAYVGDLQEPEWQQVRAMGEELSPDHPLFGDTGDGNLGAGEYDDNALSGGTAEVAGEASPSVSSSRGYNFDFDLTPAVAAVPETLEEAIDFGEESFLDHGEDLGLDESVRDSVPDAGGAPASEPAGDIHFTDFASDGADGIVSDEGFSSDPVDTKLDLARAYQEMGDAEGARAMLEEVLQEGSAAQQETARKLLGDLG